MGWNSWNKFRNQVSDKMVREMADAIVKTGMRDAGYIYVNIDDTWEGDRDAQGDGSKTRTLELVDDCQQKKSQTDGQIPPSPVSRMKSAHPPIVDQTTARWNPGR